MEFSVGDVVQGFGLHNAGRFYTVLETAPVGGNGHSRMRLEEHLTGRKFWAYTTWYRLWYRD